VEERVGGGKKSENVAPVTGEFVGAIWEGIGDSCRGETPSDSPVSDRKNRLLVGCSPIADFDFSNSLDLSVIIGGGKVASEDGIEINCTTGKDILPFSIRELREIGRVDERPFVAFRVTRVSFDEFVGFLQRGR
jgi:hypothetical protein